MPKPRLPQDPPSVEYLRECFDYCHETGVLTWKERPREHFEKDAGHRIFNSKSAGKQAGSRQPKGYVFVHLGVWALPAHRIIWAMHYGSWPADQIDHINMDKADNRISNLKEATNLENRHRTAIFRSNTSGFLGVSWHKASRKWVARLMIGGRSVSLGYFKQLEAAAEARKLADMQYGFADNHGDTNPTKRVDARAGYVCRNNSSGVVGCYWSRRSKKWKAELNLNGKRISLGSFDTLEQAAAARKAAEIEHGVTNRRGRGKVALDLS